MASCWWVCGLMSDLVGGGVSELVGLGEWLGVGGCVLVSDLVGVGK